MTRAEKIRSWRNQGLIITSKEESFEIYNRYINSIYCEKCGNKYKSNLDKHMDHSHDIFNKYGYFRNILCQSCNLKRCKLSIFNKTGYTGICKQIDPRCSQGFCWRFLATIDGKQKQIKKSVNFDVVKHFAIKWKVENEYN